MIYDKGRGLRRICVGQTMTCQNLTFYKESQIYIGPDKDGVI